MSDADDLLSWIDSQEWPMTDDAAWFDAWVERTRWTFATTMPFIPHEYTVDRWGRDDFEHAAAIIASRGYLAVWGKHPAKPYFDAGVHRYWHLGSVINRAVRREHGGAKSVDVRRVANRVTQEDE